ncbi:MAG: VCBS repeat-containing protein, partial [Bacteroidetes bacterium]|nr:VCBS repeat-containing protein [Bacteroidota bacterium]
MMKKIYLTFCALILFLILFDTSFSQPFQIVNGEIEGMANGSVNWVDVNNDGFLDIFICGRSKFDLPVSKLYLNNSGTGFVATNFEFAPVTFGSAVWGDYDNDGDLDLLLTGFTSERQSIPLSKIYRNDFPQGFTDINATLINVYKGASVWGDYDSDGDLDLIISGLK